MTGQGNSARCRTALSCVPSSERVREGMVKFLSHQNDTKKTFKKMISESISESRKKFHMTVSTSQVSAVIRTYLKHTKDKIERVADPDINPDDVRDEVTVSDNAKKILFERIGKRVVEKLKNEMAQNH